MRKGNPFVGRMGWGSWRGALSPLSFWVSSPYARNPEQPARPPLAPVAGNKQDHSCKLPPFQYQTVF